MKHLKLSAFAFITLMAGSLFAQSDKVAVNTEDSTGLPGDHFSLEGALELFKNAKSMEDFEKQLNSESSNVNNLDLNGDGDIDYIQVVDSKDANAHVIVLRISVSETETQDVAAIELEKPSEDSVVLQIVGDEELYGDSAIVEPYAEVEGEDSDNDGKGPAPAKFIYRRIVVNVWMWPCVKFVYGPNIMWVSPWHWHYYPPYWKPWKPHPWRWHYQHCHHYRVGYHHAYYYRNKGAHGFYGNHRKTSPYVKAKYKANKTAYKASKKPSPYKPKPQNKQVNKKQTKPTNKKVQQAPKQNKPKVQKQNNAPKSGKKK